METPKHVKTAWETIGVITSELLSLSRSSFSQGTSIKPQCNCFDLPADEEWLARNSKGQFNGFEIN